MTERLIRLPRSRAPCRPKEVGDLPMDQEGFPAPRKLGPTCSVWTESSINDCRPGYRATVSPPSKVWTTSKPISDPT